MLVIVAAVGAVAGVIAAISAFGIGSILTPFISLAVGLKLAVVAVSIPHLIGTAIRFWMLRRHVDLEVLKTFGIMSAAGGLTGAVLHRFAGGAVLSIVFGSLLIFAGVMGLTGRSQKLRMRGAGAVLAGGASGFLGGLVGNQGGIRAAGLLGMQIERSAFVATATAAGLIVDAVRIPIYVVFNWSLLGGLLPLIAIASAGVVAGTLAGTRLLRGMREEIFRPVVSGLIVVLGIHMIAKIL